MNHTWKKDVLPGTDMCVHCGLLRRWGRPYPKRGLGMTQSLEYYGTIKGKQVKRSRARDFNCVSQDTN